MMTTLFILLLAVLGAADSDIPTLDRIRAVERRPVTHNVDRFVEKLIQERANVVTIGAMYGSGELFFPSKFGAPHPKMNPEWLPTITAKLRAADIKPLCWVCFNVQDTRHPDDFMTAKRFPQWQMKFMDVPGRKPVPSVGMCVVSSPYIEWHAQVLREIAAFDFDGFFFDGFYLRGNSHRAQPGCTCTFCQEAFAADTGLQLPSKVDWANKAFKRWVRWRNHRLLKTARYFQSEMHKVNPDVTCTFNTNIWPFGGKDWESAVPMWRIDDFGVSQHGYDQRLERKWMILGFKCRIGRDMNPQHTDIWRWCALDVTCGKDKRDMNWHELELKTFFFAALSYGITPWHSTIEGPIELTTEIHNELAKRERYFSRDYVTNVAVLTSQNTHDFYGHIPETDHLNEYRDGLIGTWMLLTENHIPFEFVFDNQIESAVPAGYEVLVLPNAAAMSKQMLDNVAAWVHQGGHLIATAKTACYDEWGDKLGHSQLEGLFGITVGDATASKVFGQGRITYLPTDPGMAYCRDRATAPADALLAAIRETPLPFTINAPPSLVVNMFRSPDGNQRWVHLLNVSPFMPDGDTGFQGLTPPATKQTKAIRSRSLAPLVPAKNITLQLPGQTVQSAKLVVGDQPPVINPDGIITIPVVKHHDVLVLTLR